MKAIILAAGMGSRLMPLTADKPKCMVPLADEPLLHRQIRTLRGAGAQDITLLGGYRADRLGGAFDRLVLNPAYDSTNMVATLFCALDAMTEDDDLLISYGDIVYEPRVVEAVLACDAPLVTAVDLDWHNLWSLRLDNPLDDAESLILRDTNQIVELGRKPQSYDDIQGQYIGLTRVRGDFVKSFVAHWRSLDRSAVYDGKDFANMYMTSFLQSLIDAGHPMRAAFIRGGWLEVDTLQDLDRYEALHARQALAPFIDLEA